MTDLGIVIVNWNTQHLLRKCLDTVFASTGDFSFRVVVVDNASTDDSAAMVRQHFPQAELIVSEVNGGFSHGNNLGLRHLGYHGAGDVAADAPRYALLLNPDTEVPPNSFYDMINMMDSHPEVGMAGPKLLLEDGTIDKACRRSFPTPKIAFYHFSGLAKLFPKSPRFARYNMTHVDENQQLEVDSVVGAYMQLRREVIEAIGLLDETFFMYGEDLDWAYRTKQAGWKVMYYPEVIVWHIKRAASRKSKKAQFEFYRAMLIFYRKHYRTKTPLWLHSLVMTGLMLKGGRGLWGEIRQSRMQAANV
ncbi:MAG: glycosyltransferase family 2 protein [Chloroflexi bacterium AL-W]|nr:glycosyltransferase family 2 protein [Chloroflexi bacterium AL-W]